LRTRNFQTTDCGRAFGQQGLRDYGVTCSGTNLANVRAGIRGGKIATKVELRAQQKQGEAQNQQANGRAIPAHGNTTTRLRKNMCAVNVWSGINSDKKHNRMVCRRV
jgi:hypothetical protein